MTKINQNQSTLVIIDIQERLVPLINQAKMMIESVNKLVRAAQFLNIPILATEQYPEGLGVTIDNLLPTDVAPIAKTTFDACLTPQFVYAADDFKTFVVAGCESHVCVLQTVLGLIDLGKTVFLVVDAVGSRTSEDREYALRRMERLGANLVTTEMVLFEWLVDAKHPNFRQVQQLIK